jgi:hypothetical protein
MTHNVSGVETPNNLRLLSASAHECRGSSPTNPSLLGFPFPSLTGYTTRLEQCLEIICTKWRARVILSVDPVDHRSPMVNELAIEVTHTRTSFFNFPKELAKRILTYHSQHSGSFLGC